MKNYIQQFMNDNNLVVGERFKINEKRYYFTPQFELCVCIDKAQCDGIANIELINNLYSGRYTVEKLPFKPNMGECYWTYSSTTGHAVEFEYMGDFADALRVKNNFAFRTREEAEDPKNIARVKEYCGVLDND